jgi:hypothetical protein
MKQFRAAADIEILPLFDPAKLESASSEDVPVQSADLGIVGKRPAELGVREIHLGDSLGRRLGFFSTVANHLRSDEFEKLPGRAVLRFLKY